MSRPDVFARNLERYAKRTGASLEQTARAVTIELFNGVVMATPVGNPDLWGSPAPPGYVGGRARGNWQVSVGAPVSQETSRIDSQGSAVESEIASTVVSGEVNYLSNNLPYIGRLEYEGWSTQAPAGMVRKNMQRVRKIVAEEARKAF